MRIITCVITVDGLIEAPVPKPDGWLIMDGDHEQPQLQMFTDAAAMLLGRKSYEGFAAVWPTMAGPWADRLNSMPKYVASKTLDGPLTWNASLIKGDLVEGVKRLKSELDGDLMVSGSGTFARFLAENGLVDEVFWVHPTVQGKGDRPFLDGPPIDLTPLGVEAFDSGVALLRYRPIAA